MISAEGSSMAGAPRQPSVSLDHAGPMPLVGLGTGALTGRQCYQAVRYALEVGYRHIDTATMYFNEPEVGQAVRDSEIPRQEVAQRAGRLADLDQMAIRVTQIAAELRASSRPSELGLNG
jgi:diketogulonate reductase-like aldo/keto reductase